MSGEKAERIAVRVPSYANAQEEEHDDRMIQHIVKLTQDAWEKAEAVGISQMDYDQLVAQVEDVHKHMKFPELDSLSGEPLEMLKEYIK